MKVDYISYDLYDILSRYIKNCLYFFRPPLPPWESDVWAGGDGPHAQSSCK